MRADRLLSLLLLLQTRGRMTAAALAAALEVSERTVYRDLDALANAGVPVYAERGPGGGCALLGSYRTTLTGLTDAETRALFMLTIPAALADLGLGDELRAALLKLSAALSSRGQTDEAWVRQRVFLDWSAAALPSEPTPHLQTLQQAVWSDHRLRLTYRLDAGPHHEVFERVVEPYGLVAQAGVWHLVCAAEGRLRVYRVADILAAQPLDEAFTRPVDFDLARFWQERGAERTRQRRCYLVRVRVAPTLARDLPPPLGEQAREALAQVEPDGEGWLTLSLTFASLEDARTTLLGWGGVAEVLEPLALRLSMADYAEQVAARYGSKPRSNSGR